MSRMDEIERSLMLPAQAPTDVRCSYKKAKGEWVFVDVNGSRDAWIEIDDQHVHLTEAME